MTPKHGQRARGEILYPGQPEYEAARNIHNGMIDRRPALIARCHRVEDVIASVRLSRERNALLSVCGGGHGVAGFAVCDAGVMIDLSQMREVEVDAERRTARVQGGATWGDVDRETQACGLATTGGVARPTGVAGLTLGGGHGFLMRKHGLACDNLISAEVVTADGDVLNASAHENSDLFWALRGGGGNFGVVTSLEFQLHPVGQVLGGLLIYPVGYAPSVLAQYRELTAVAPDELGSLAVAGRLPDGTPVAVIMICYSGEHQVGERLLQPLRNCAPLIADQVGPMPYVALQSIVENFNPRGLRNYWKSSYLTGIPDRAIQTMLDHFAEVPSPFAHIVIEHLGGAVARVPDEATAVAHRDRAYNMLVVGMWQQPDEDERGTAWVRKLWTTMQRFSSGGAYVNYLGMEPGAEGAEVSASYPGSIYARLQTIKRKFDPANVFRMNHNIRLG